LTVKAINIDPFLSFYLFSTILTLDLLSSAHVAAFLVIVILGFVPLLLVLIDVRLLERNALMGVLD